ncbi:hypothetical protein P153DRAFT_359887 [Dothidotthia symphoricarpi CBS 119687]|uniref:Uncharacterized protein n=1 Tax=Dothidotthia symphoricarpi CBS 119687 TaxID=1392245 RepID=A0A6A6A2K6_9PLEO|nr:uncharacterized protein P153DRAFT_359887 [Dothidotthia symphoricarpi CBS 119687]KAF2126232.1 hypothetical protein P153DRAFT_359887 [Dothidotthia symphoricarpi CBS 119687]
MGRDRPQKRRMRSERQPAAADENAVARIADTENTVAEAADTVVPEMSAESLRILAALKTETDAPRLSRDDEPRRPGMNPPSKPFWELFNIDAIDTDDAEERRNRIAAFKMAVDICLTNLKNFRTWGAWATEKLDLSLASSDRLFAVATGLRDELESRRSSLDAVAEAEKMLDEGFAEEQQISADMKEQFASLWTHVKVFQETLDINQLRVACFALAQASGTEVRASRYSEAMLTASEKESARREVEEEKRELRRVRDEVVSAKESILATEQYWLGFHTAMVDFAVPDQDPVSTAKFAWMKGEVFVPNLCHQYWKGREFARWLKSTNALESTDSIFHGAYERDPSTDGVSLQHPNGVIAGTSWFVGIRHEMRNEKLQREGKTYPALPEHLNHLLDQRRDGW